jgi:hypothetical protein
MGSTNTDPVNVRSFGAMGDGVTDDRAAIQAAFDTGRPVVFPDERAYYINGKVTRSADNVDISLGRATVVFGGSDSGFIFGGHADRPRYKRLRFDGGTIKNRNPVETANRLFIFVGAYEDFDVSNVRMEGVSNGGIEIGSGCRDGSVEDINIVSASAHSTLRGIWLNGSGTSDYQDELVDVSSITRNAKPLPAGGVRNVKVRNCRIRAPIFGIYTHNAHYCTIEGNHIDISGSGARCITINAYSPRAVVKGNELIGDRTATAILVGQFSQGVTIEGNQFRGTFGLGADVKVQSLSQAQIRGNKFLTSTMISIVCDLGGAAVIESNEFTAPSPVSGQRPLRIYTIDANESGKSPYGNTAGALPGTIFQRNVIKNRPMGVQITQQTAANGNSPGLQFCIVRDNTFENMDLSNGAEEYGLFIETRRGRNRVNYSYVNNRFLPRARPDRNTARDVGGFGVDIGRRETAP